jgi:hypothetical protein
VPPALDEWYIRQSERVLTRQTSQVETVKLVVTFSLAIATTLVATGLQVDPVTGADIAACGLLAASFLGTVWAIGLDNLQEPDASRAEALRMQHGLTDDQFLATLRYVSMAAEDFNEHVVRRVRRAAVFQLLLVVATSACSGVSLLVRQA